MSLEQLLALLNGMAGLAALLNSALMWPTIKALKHLGDSHGRRIEALEAKRVRRRGTLRTR